MCIIREDGKGVNFHVISFLTPFFLVAAINFPEIPKSNQKKEGGVGCFFFFFSFYFLFFLPWWFLPDFLPLSHPPQLVLIPRLYRQCSLQLTGFFNANLIFLSPDANFSMSLDSLIFYLLCFYSSSCKANFDLNLLLTLMS